MPERRTRGTVDRIPPHSKETEQSALGVAMLSEEALSEVMDEVEPKDFYDPAHKEIFTAIIELFRRSEPVDIVTVSEELSKRGSLELAGGRTYIASLTESAPATSNARGYAKLVAQKAVISDLILAGDAIKEKGFEESMDAEDLLDYAEQSIYEIGQGRQRSGGRHIKDILIENTKMIDKANKADGKLGLTTGFVDLDKKTSGLQKGDLIILAARPSMGKSAFALSMALNAAKKDGASVLIFTLEMTQAQMGQRLLSMESNVELSRLREGKVDNRDWKSINLAIDQMAKTTIIIDDSAQTVLQMKNKCRRMAAKEGLDMVIIDYLQLMGSEGRTENRQQEVSKMSRQLKLMAKELNCPVVVLSQLSRAPELRNNKRPMLSDLRESGSIEQDADMVIFLYRDDYYNKEESEKPNVCEVNLAKNRNGEVGEVELTWVARYTKFADRIGETNEVYDS